MLWTNLEVVDQWSVTEMWKRKEHLLIFSTTVMSPQCFARIAQQLLLWRQIFGFVTSDILTSKGCSNQIFFFHNQLLGSQAVSNRIPKNPGIFRDFGIAQKTMFTKTFICFQTASGSFLYSQNLSKCFNFLLYRPWQILPFTSQWRSQRAKKDFSCWPSN